jgi:cell division protein FtsW (lipid II flippase)
MGLLMAWGMLIQTRLGSFQFHEGIRLYMWAYVGVLPIFWAMVLLRGRGLRVLRGLHVLAAVGAGLFMYWLVLKGGTTFRGARFGPLLTTPSEALKLLLVIYLAGYLTRRVERGFEGVLGARLVGEGLLFVALWSIPQVMFLIQRDLGVIVLFGVLLIVMFFVATGRPGYLYGGAVITGFSAAVLYDLFPHVHARWEAWLNPWADPRGRGWQTLQALFALRAGWLDGSGLGNGYPHVIPIVASDFVYAALAEEMGLWGCAMILLTFSVLFWRGWRIAERAETTFNRFLALGLTTLLATQTFVNLAGVLRVLPITGLTLPFLSRGGSSLLVSTAMVGLLAAISDAREPSTEEE